MTELTRRDLLERGAAAAGALALAGVPNARAAAGTFDGTIRLASNYYDLGLFLQPGGEGPGAQNRRRVRRRTR